MLIDWEHAQQLVEDAAENERRRRVRVAQLRHAARSVGDQGRLLGTDFAAAAVAYRTAHPLVLDPDEPERRLDRLEELFGLEKVRNAVGQLIRKADNGKLLRFVHQVADELERERGNTQPSPLQPDRLITHSFKWDDRAALKLRTCNDPDAARIGLHVHADPEAPDGLVLGAVKLQRERCWLRICPKCAKDIAARLRKRYEGRIVAVVAQQLAGCSLKHLVLTLARTDDLAADLVKLHRCTKQLVKHFWPGGSRGKGPGAFAVAEIGPKGGNVHVHVIVYGRFVRQSSVSDYWRKLTGNRVVWIRAVTLEQALREGIKYITKLGKRGDDGEFTVKPLDLAQLHMALKGRRRVFAWGAFYGLGELDRDGEPVEPEPDDDEDDRNPHSALCSCGAPMVFLSVPEARGLLHLKDANNWRLWPAHSGALGPPTSSGP